MEIKGRAIALNSRHQMTLITENYGQRTKMHRQFQVSIVLRQFIQVIMNANMLGTSRIQRFTDRLIYRIDSLTQVSSQLPRLHWQ